MNDTNRTDPKSKRRRKYPIPKIGYEPHLDRSTFEMKALVSNLNHPFSRSVINPAEVLDFSQMQAELRWLVSEWQASGPNLKMFFAKYPDIERRIVLGKTQLMITKAARGYLEWEPILRDSGGSQRDLALAHFAVLIVNPLWETLGGPCARCGNYYVKKRRSQKIYCSTKCGSRTTSAIALRERRRKQHALRVETVQELIDKWVKLRKRGDWREWAPIRNVASKKWITRNREKLRFPSS